MDGAEQSEGGMFALPDPLLLMLLQVLVSRLGPRGPRVQLAFLSCQAGNAFTALTTR